MYLKINQYFVNFCIQIYLIQFLDQISSNINNKINFNPKNGKIIKLGFHQNQTRPHPIHLRTPSSLLKSILLRPRLFQLQFRSRILQKITRIPLRYEPKRPL